MARIVQSALVKTISNGLILNPAAPLSSSFSIVPHRKHGFFGRCIKKPAEDPFVIVRAAREDQCEILNLMWDAYHPDEPSTCSLGLGDRRNCVFDDHARKYLCQGLSLVARCKYSGCIVGASINTAACPWDPDLTEELACTLSCPRMTKLFMFYAHLQRAPKLWEKYCQNQVFEMANVFVRPCDRRKGVAKRLMEASKILGGDAGFRIIRVDATNVHTARICEKLKMKKIYELPYCSYVGEDNEPVLKIPPPNTGVKVYIDLPHAMYFR